LFVYCFSLCLLTPDLHHKNSLVSKDLGILLAVF
jgi:hypothetical protein